ncbi:MAG: zf-HC2 domain-containing protein [Gemmatimonadaceae bacterium]
MTISLFHPRAGALQRFADGETTPLEHSRVSAHLTSCHQCRRTVGSTRDVTAQARLIASPTVSPELIEKILSTRAAGDRIILPRDDERTTGRSRMIGSIAAGMMLVIGAAGYLAFDSRSSRTSPVIDNRATTGSPYDDSIDMPISTPGVFISRLLLPSTAAALQPSTLPRLRGVDGRRLKAGQYFFSRIETTALGAQSRATGRGLLRVSPWNVAGVPSWLVEHRWTMEPGTNGVRIETESLVVRQRDLTPVMRTVHVSPYLRYSRLNISQRFTGDSVSGSMSAEINDKVTVRRPIAKFLAPASGPYMSEASAPLMLSAVRLHAGWAASLSLVGWAVVPADVRYPIQLRVTGEERIRVPAGEFDCWRLAVTHGTVVHTYWVRKSDGLGIRTKVDRKRSSGTKGNHEIVLTREVK